MSRYLIIIEKTESGFSAYSPDIAGCVATGRTRDETEASMRDAIAFHLDGMREEGLPVPQPSSVAAYVEVAA
jgi:predicted RNase H-like HicB family nuclease